MDVSPLCQFALDLSPLRAYSKDFLIIHTSMASAVARAYNGGLGAEPPAGVQGAEPPVGPGGEAPLKLTRFCV